MIAGALRILQLVHGLPPDRAGGTETYAWQLSRALAVRGHAVEVLAATKDLSRADLSLHSCEREGVLVHSLANNLLHEDFRSTWDDARVAAALSGFVRERAFDLVHVQHLIHLGSALPGLLAARGAMVVMTLHDYWSVCARHGQRLRPDGSLCAEIDPRRCGSCLLSFEHKQGGLERRVLPLARVLRRATGLDIAPAARRAKALLARHPSGPLGAREEARAVALEREVVERNAELRARLSDSVARFFAPSRFLLERAVVDGGLPRERIEHLPFGVDLPPSAPRAPRLPGAPLVVGFLGARIRAKGPDLLLRAWGALPSQLRARGILRLHGSDRSEASYQAELRVLARDCGARLGGALDRAGVAAFLSECDLLVVPSRWWENAPLVVQEARAARVPLLVAGHGGLAEFVEPGVDGWHFAPGSIEDLRGALARVLSRELDTMGLDPRPVPPFGRHVDQLEARYRELVAKDVAR
jgi:glycosyltransferase involved in cell wall biosynthesis